MVPLFTWQMTSMIAGFVTRIRSAITDEGFLQQMFKVGVLAEFESLLSCYGDEMGMLEDMIIALADLSLMRFRLVKEQRPGDIMPRLEGGRYVCMHIDVHEFRPGMLALTCRLLLDLD